PSPPGNSGEGKRLRFGFPRRNIDLQVCAPSGVALRFPAPKSGQNVRLAHRPQAYVPLPPSGLGTANKGENFLRTGADVGYNRSMLQTARPKKKKAPTKAPVHEKYLEAFRWMLLARTFEEKLASMYRGGRITGGVYVGKGQEAVSVACGIFLQKGNVFAPLIRDQAGRSAFGEPLVDVARTYLGTRT